MAVDDSTDADVPAPPSPGAAHELAVRAACDGGDAPPTDPGELLRWLAAPEHDGPIAISRYVAAIRRSRKDLLDAFPAVPGRDAARLNEWVRLHGVHEIAIPPELVPAPAPPPPPAPYLQPGVNLAGFLTAELGVGEVARRLAAAMDAASVPYSTYTFERTANRRAHHVRSRDAHHYDTNVVCVNADSIGAFVQQVGPAFSAGRRRIGVWFWETEDFPSMFHSAYGDVDELWAASDFVADALRASAPPGLPVVRFPLPIVAPPVDASATRQSLGLPASGFVFLFSFDYLSIAERKNPYGLVEAYRAAFDAGSDVHLVLKSINADRRPGDAERLAQAAAGRPDIVLLDGYLDAAENSALLAAADCVVSLHRSEGFGFNLADAMALGVPVIATGYSGNLAFMRDDDCMLVDYRTVPVGDGHFPYEAGSTWADPDLDHAARLMREVHGDPAAARARASAARARVLREFSPEVTGTFIRNRVAALRAAAPIESPAAPPPLWQRVARAARSRAVSARRGLPAPKLRPR